MKNAKGLNILPHFPLILGALPLGGGGGGGHYQKDRFAKPEDLLRGNCDFKKEGNPHFPICEWLIVRRLVSILDYGHTSHMDDLLKDESRFVFTNATFFSTHKEAGLKGTLRNSFFYGYDASDIVHTMIDDQRHTFNHHHRGVESQCLRFVNAYFTDESIEVHQ